MSVNPSLIPLLIRTAANERGSFEIWGNKSHGECYGLPNKTVGYANVLLANTSYFTEDEILISVFNIEMLIVAQLVQNQIFSSAQNIPSVISPCVRIGSDQR
jgi:hypothetical protein